MPRSDSPESSPHTELASLKRRIVTLEEQNAELRKQPQHASGKDKLNDSGRGIRRLVCLRERVEDLIAKFDRRILLGANNESEADSTDLLQNARYRSYKMLVLWCPCVRELLQSGAERKELADSFSKLNNSADSARADGTTRLKRAVADWLMDCIPCPAPPIKPYDKRGRGLNHDVTGRLICPVDYNWDDSNNRQAIRGYHPDYMITASSWPMFLYANRLYDHQNPRTGLFQGELLLKAFKYLFTSPTSAELVDPENQHDGVSAQRHSRCKRTTGELRTRRHVAGILNMTSVQPQAIAYTAVQLRFALSGIGSWRTIDDTFDYQEFYDNVVELAATPDAAKAVDDLLLRIYMYLDQEMRSLIVLNRSRCYLLLAPPQDESRSGMHVLVL
ncbi:hypothetical protein AZE42_11133 [Rhizopogon vesiculosus]|uniref:Uncharacterized protein n=1 Tax=Rhizopogon vesiculosus TaxID=180088 RepID=A0A1J8Q9I3_9AGAM|nr:hypothetical protein AZE42_11133 [Rhizopogon vesiculosus]